MGQHCSTDHAEVFHHLAQWQTPGRGIWRNLPRLHHWCRRVAPNSPYGRKHHLLPRVSQRLHEGRSA